MRVLRVIGSLCQSSAFNSSSVKPTVPKKRDGLFDRQTASHQRGMRYADHNVIDHAVEPGVLDRYPSVVRLRQKYRRYRIDRPVSRDDADRIINRRQDRVEVSVAGRDEALAGRPEPGARRENIFQAIAKLPVPVR